MNLSPKWCAYLNTAGHDAVHWGDFGNRNAPDAEIMGWAAENDRVILTSDLDFGAMLAASRDSRPSVLQLRSDGLSPEQIGASVLRAIEAAQLELEGGALLTVDIARSRLRSLPFNPHA